MKKIYKYLLCASFMVAMMIGGQVEMWGSTYYARGIIQANYTGGEGTVYVSKSDDFSSASESVSFDNSSSSSPIEIQADVYLKAVPANGYHFVQWLEGSSSGTQIGTTAVGQKYRKMFSIASSSTSSDKPATETQNVCANFAPNYLTKVTTSVNNSSYGNAYVSLGSSFSGTSTEAADTYGQTSTGVDVTYSIKAIAKDGYHFTDWSATNGSWSTSTTASTTIKVKTQSGNTYGGTPYTCTATASFGPNYTTKVTASTSPSAGGTAYVAYGSSFSGTSTTADDGYGQGWTGYEETYSIKATAKTGYHFVNWSVTNGTLTSSSTASTTVKVKTKSGYTYGGTRYPCTVTATFAENFYATLNTGVTTGTSGSVSGSGTKNVETSGGSCEFNLTAPAASSGYYFTGWTGTGITFASPSSLSTKATVSASTTGGSSKAATYTATANYAEYSRIINITASGTPAESGDQVIFVVDGPQTYRVAVPVGGSVTLKDVVSGTYTITPQGWSWDYNVDKSSESTSWSSENISNHTFTFTTKGSTKKHSEAKVTVKP